MRFRGERNEKTETYTTKEMDLTREMETVLGSFEDK